MLIVYLVPLFPHSYSPPVHWAQLHLSQVLQNFHHGRHCFSSTRVLVPRSIRALFPLLPEPDLLWRRHRLGVGARSWRKWWRRRGRGRKRRSTARCRRVSRCRGRRHGGRILWFHRTWRKQKKEALLENDCVCLGQWWRDSLLRLPTCRWSDNHGDLSAQLQQLALQRRDLLQGSRVRVLALHSSPSVGQTRTWTLVFHCIPAKSTLLLWGQKVPAETKDVFFFSKAVDQR